MTRINIFRNYGELAAEKRNIYTFGGTSETATCADEITVELPESWDLCENCFGQPLLEAPREPATLLTRSSAVTNIHTLS